MGLKGLNQLAGDVRHRAASFVSPMNEVLISDKGTGAKNLHSKDRENTKTRSARTNMRSESRYLKKREYAIQEAEGNRSVKFINVETMLVS